MEIRMIGGRSGARRHAAARRIRIVATRLSIEAARVYSYPVHPFIASRAHTECPRFGIRMFRSSPRSLRKRIGGSQISTGVFRLLTARFGNRREVSVKPLARFGN